MVEIVLMSLLMFVVILIILVIVLIYYVRADSKNGDFKRMQRRVQSKQLLNIEKDLDRQELIETLSPLMTPTPPDIPDESSDKPTIGYGKSK